VETSAQIQGGKPASTMEVIHKLIKDRHMKLGLLCNGIEVPEVHTKAVFPSFFFTSNTGEENALALR